MTIKEAAKKLHVEAHVLRYWEDELKLDIKRNAQTIDCAKTAQEETDNEDKPCKPEANIKRTSSVELRPVHTRMDEDKDSMLERMQKMVGDEDKVVDFKQAQLQSVMNRVIATALRENKDIITTSIKEEVTADVMRQFDAVMREKEEREEARYRRLDTVLREIQQANAEVAATKTKKGIFKKHR